MLKPIYLGEKAEIDEKYHENQNGLHASRNYHFHKYIGRVKRIWYLSPMRAAKVQASLRIRAVAPEPPLLAHTSSETRGTFRQKARSLAPLNGWACVVKICHDRMLKDTNSLDASHMYLYTKKDCNVTKVLDFCLKFSR